MYVHYARCNLVGFWAAYMYSKNVYMFHMYILKLTIESKDLKSSSVTLKTDASWEREMSTSN